MVDLAGSGHTDRTLIGQRRVLKQLDTMHSLAIVLVIHVLGVSLRIMLGLLTIVEVLTLGLSEAVYLGADKADEDLLSELVFHRLAYLCVN